MTQLETDLEKNSEENAKFEKKLGEIFMQHDDLEQYTRKFNLQIHGIPENQSGYEPLNLENGSFQTSDNIDTTDWRF